MKDLSQELKRDYNVVIVNFARFALCGVLAILVMVYFLGNGPYATEGFDWFAVTVVVLLASACIWFLKRLEKCMCAVINSDEFRKLWEQSVK